MADDAFAFIQAVFHVILFIVVHVHRARHGLPEEEETLARNQPWGPNRTLDDWIVGLLNPRSRICPINPVSPIKPIIHQCCCTHEDH